MVVSHIAPKSAGRARRLGPLVILVLLFGVGTGCQTTRPITNERLIEHQALIDFSGLAPVEPVGEVRAVVSRPRNWQLLPFKQNALYAHAQWKSPSSYTGIGAVYIRMPLPLGDKAMIWLAKREYTNKANDGRVIREWTDDLGRCWFEAENNKYHVQGYALTRGFNAWIVYFGYKTGFPPDLAELSIAARAAETFVPDENAATPKPGEPSATASAE
jgi:hypothetical protein